MSHKWFLTNAYEVSSGWPAIRTARTRSRDSDGTATFFAHGRDDRRVVGRQNRVCNAYMLQAVQRALSPGPPTWSPRRTLPPALIRSGSLVRHGASDVEDDRIAHSDRISDVAPQKPPVGTESGAFVSTYTQYVVSESSSPKTEVTLPMPGSIPRDPTCGLIVRNPPRGLQISWCRSSRRSVGGLGLKDSDATMMPVFRTYIVIAMSMGDGFRCPQ
ncbi:hypothetical protein VTK73DRAFT_3637 [Phialemonium thermophilum]|uniref:Uncharacterized protein n=1 Tax=Phialemonium thermophilum TaxID=223376 RepID=A0ABR3WYT4_9PEZI